MSDFITKLIFSSSKTNVEIMKSQRKQNICKFIMKGFIQTFSRSVMLASAPHLHLTKKKKKKAEIVIGQLG